jgi:hypothetical protein
MLLVVGALFGAVFIAPQAALSDAGAHVTWVNGLSVIQPGSCEYEWKKDANGEPIRDELGIPQPTTLPPTCRDGSPAPGLQTVGCNLKRNLGPYKPYWRNGDATKGEVGLNPPCSGVLSADIQAAFPVGCADVNTQGTPPSNLLCDLIAPTWFYGFCAQTYGGADSGSIKLSGNTKTWAIDRLGFPRGRGVWEFSVKAHESGNASNTQVFRFYLDALPNPTEPGNAAGCDGGSPIHSVEFFGFVESPPAPVKVFRTKPGWHFCADDPVLGAAGNEGC